MNQTGKIQRSIQLFKSSIAVMRKHPKLLWFPFLIGMFTLIIAAFFFVPVAVVAAMHATANGAGHWYNSGLFARTSTGQPSPAIHWFALYMCVLYPISMFVATYCNVALYSQIMAALNGEEVSIGRGLQVARGKLKSILVWSLFAGLVGVLIRIVQRRFGVVGRIVTGLVGLAWSVASVFAIPVIVREEPMSNPVQILKKSAGTIKRTWGEALTGYVGLGLINLVFVLALMVLCGLGIALSTMLKSPWVFIPVGVLCLVLFLVYSYVASLAEQTYRCALYIYASEGVVPEPYSQELLDQAWKVKQG